MKNLRNFEEDCFNIYIKAVNSKNNGIKKEALKSIKNIVGLLYLTYSEKFEENKITDVVSYGFSGIEKESLIDLYQFKSKVIKEIKNKILNSQIRTINATCQYCTLNSVGSLDHFIPKESFPEFSVNPLNLYPCCPECNSKKSNYSFDGGQSLFLNLYLDKLPNKRYLKAEFDFTDEIPLVTFTLYNPDEIEEDLFKTICSHYGRLNLLERMREKSNEVISEIILSFNTYYRLNPNIEIVKNFIISEEHENKEAYGFNYWKSVLRLSLIQYDEFWKKYVIKS